MADEVEIPTYQDLFVPTLQALDQLGGTAGNEQIEQAMIAIADLSPEQLAVEITPDQTLIGSKIVHRAAWARTYLRKAGLIDNPERAVWSLCDEGRDLLRLPPAEAHRRRIEIASEVRRAQR